MVVSFAGFELDPARRELRHGDDLVAIEPQVFDVLAFLVAHRDRVVSKEDLLDGVWGDRFVGESALTSRIKAARRAVGDDGARQAVIRTFHGRGYRFVAPVVEVGEAIAWAAAADRSESAGARGAAAGTAAAVVPRYPVHYARNDSLNIAYQVTGGGPMDLVLVPGFVSHLELDWADPNHAHFLHRLGTMGRLIRFDKRGTGLSDRPTGGPPDLETRMSDARAVMDAAGSDRAVVFGYSEGGPMAALFAATYPTRVAALVIYGSYARRLHAPDYPWASTPEERQRYGERLEREWGWEADMQRMCPSADEATARWWGERCRAAASPGAAKALIEMNSQIDVRDVLPAVRAPTIVLHRAGDRDSNVEEGRYVASRIRHARFVELPGVDHFVGIEPDQILDPIEDFLASVEEVMSGRSFLATVIAVDGASGPDRAALERAVDDVLASNGGLPARSSVESVLATVDGPARAIRCAKEVADVAAVLGLAVGVGVHTTEVVAMGGALEGAGLGVAASIAAAADRGRVLVSDTVAGLVAGSGVALTEWRLDESIHPRPMHLAG